MKEAGSMNKRDAHETGSACAQGGEQQGQESANESGTQEPQFEKLRRHDQGKQQLSRITPAGISVMPMTQATLKLLMVSWRSYSANAVWISRLLGVPLAMLGFPHLNKDVHFRGILEDARTFSATARWGSKAALFFMPR